LGAVAVLIGLATPSATAQSEDALIVTLDAPAEGAVLDSSSVVVSGEVRLRDDLNLNVLSAEIGSVKVTLVPEGGGPSIGPIEACPCGPTPVRFSSKPIPVPTNGRYRANVVASGKVLSDVKGSRSRAFGVAAPPRAPQDVKVEVSPERVVAVSWARNTEPDLLGYTVLRKGPGADTYVPIALNVAQPQPDSPRVSFSDSLAALTGGEFTYQVRAVRPGATPGSRVTSEPATSEPVSLGAPAPTGPGTAPGSGLLGTFPPAQTNSTAARPRTVEPPDTGFSEALPFGARPSEEEQVEEPAEPRSFGVATPESEFAARGRPLVPVAAGAVLLLLAIHVRLLTKRMEAASPSPVSGAREDEVTASDLDYVERSPRVPVPAAAVGPEPRPYGPAPRQPLYDWAQLADYARAPVFDVEEDEWAREYSTRGGNGSRAAVASPVR